jgi:hypothetical protein
MSKPLSKGGMERPATLMVKLPHRSHYQTRAATQAANSNKAATQLKSEPDAPAKGNQNATSKAIEVSKETSGSNSKQLSTLLQIIASAINQLLIKERVNKPVKITLERILKYIKIEEERGPKGVENYTMQAEVSTIHIKLKQDLVKIQDALATQFANIHATMSTMLENTAKMLADTRDIKEATKDITSRVGKVNDAADKIASTTQSYRDILTQNPIAAGKNDLDPKSREIWNVRLAKFWSTSTTRMTTRSLAKA